MRTLVSLLSLTAALGWGWLDQHPLDGTTFDPDFDEPEAQERLAEIVRHHLGEVPPDLKLTTVNELGARALKRGKPARTRETS